MLTIGSMIVSGRSWGRDHSKKRALPSGFGTLAAHYYRHFYEF